MAQPALSVVIPTRDRPRHLLETLEALAGQDADFEVLLVNDGSGAETRDLLASPPELPFALRILHQPPLGPAAARNRGVTAARGERILLLGDDIRPAPGCLARHAAAPGDVGLQGLVEWDPQREITPLMDWLAPAGPQFYFKGFRGGEAMPFTTVTSANASLPARWLREQPFDEGFPAAAGEDTEAAYRWSRRGWSFLFAPGALAWHHHHYDELEPFLARQRRAGAAARYTVSRHRRLWWTLVGREKLALFRVAWRGRFGRGRATDAWDLACRRAYFEGYERAAR